MAKIDLWKAIEEMRSISASGGTFSIKFRKWDRQRNRGGELVTVEAARLRPAAYDEKVSHASYKLFFTDTATGKARVCWQMLIMEFNGIKTTVN